MNEMRVKVNGGHLVVSENPDGTYAGFSITYEADSGDIIDVVRVEAPDEHNRERLVVYNYEDVWQEDYTNRHIIDTNEALKAIKTLWTDRETEFSIDKSGDEEAFKRRI